MAVRPAQIWLPQAMINDPAYPQRLRRFFFSFVQNFVRFIPSGSRKHSRYGQSRKVLFMKKVVEHLNKIFCIHIEKYYNKNYCIKAFWFLSLSFTST